jgi:hypothetical protein
MPPITPGQRKRLPENYPLWSNCSAVTTQGTDPEKRREFPVGWSNGQTGFTEKWLRPVGWVK